MPAKRKSAANGGAAKKSKAAAPCSFGFSYEAGTEVPAGPGAKYRDELAATAKAM